MQPAEEGLGGGRVMVEEGCLDPLGPLPNSSIVDVVSVEEVYAAHVWNLMRPGVIGVRSGPVMANSDRVFFKVTGHGGHAGRPPPSSNLQWLFIIWHHLTYSLIT